MPINIISWDVLQGVVFIFVIIDFQIASVFFFFITFYTASFFNGQTSKKICRTDTSYEIYPSHADKHWFIA